MLIFLVFLLFLYLSRRVFGIQSSICDRDFLWHCASAYSFLASISHQVRVFQCLQRSLWIDILNEFEPNNSVLLLTMHKKWSFWSRIFSVNVTESVVFVSATLANFSLFVNFYRPKVIIRNCLQISQEILANASEWIWLYSPWNDQ